MNAIHFRSLDLNLLRLFVALWDERHATRAASRLGLTQSAVSHALARLREALDDPLFVREKRSLVPTARAREIAPAIRRTLETLEVILAPSAFDAATSDRQFTVAAGSYACQVILPGLFRLISAEAPGIRLRIVRPDAETARDLELGYIDAAIFPAQALSARFVSHELFTESAVWAVRAGHPAAEGGLSAAKLSTIPLVAVTGASPWTHEQTDDRWPEDFPRPHWIEDYFAGVSAGRPAAIVPGDHAAILIVLSADYAALLPRRFAMAAWLRPRLALFEPVDPPKPITVSAITSAANAENPAVQWLLQSMKRAASDAVAQCDGMIRP
ncbi:LysR family transcriptional regulator [Consotaella salsifontis]|uniref:Transcriptional regulator, LysR family n=1 Tax=Consotaella salsifontis TaxID=1365950 RepID=A0A1T4T454_9HYPH|nr:LysR family transcriptional regulator [Consotaella salsifontis]SKA35079.1 transcriptional regulator, LysR family [Consotaella salsifontis]